MQSVISLPGISLTKEELQIGSVNTFLATGAAYVLLGSQLAVITGVATAALYAMNPKREKNYWLPLQARNNSINGVFIPCFNIFIPNIFTPRIQGPYIHGLEKLKYAVYIFLPYCAIVNVFYGVIFLLAGITTFQAPAFWLLSSIKISELAYKLFRICIVAPFIEEILFRGVLQESLFNIQGAFRGISGDCTSDLSKTLHTVIQAGLFGLAHIHPSQTALANFFILIVTTYAGFKLAEVKEEEGQDLWACMGLHASINMAVASRFLVLGV